MATANLNESVSVTLDADGNGTASVGPLSALESWHPQNVHVSVSTDDNEAVCKIYVGDNAGTDRTFRDGTFSGSSGDSSDRVNADTVQVGHKVWAVWTGGDAGAIATLNVTGTKVIG